MTDAARKPRRPREPLRVRVVLDVRARSEADHREAMRRLRRALDAMRGAEDPATAGEGDANPDLLPDVE